MVFILDEWLIHDIMGQNGKERQNKAGSLLFEIIKKCDKIAIVRGSKFAKKSIRFLNPTTLL